MEGSENGGMEDASPSDFSFAFCSPQFSDCTLCLHTERGPAPADRGSADTELGTGEFEEGLTGSDFKPQAREVPVSRVILVAKSRFFRKMLTGGFREASSWSKVDIFLEADEEPFFMDLLQSMYSGSLPEGVPQSLDRTLRVLVLADRFEVREALQSCTTSLSALVSSLSPPDAFRILELPFSIRRLPRFAPILESAKHCISAKFSPMLRNMQHTGSFLDLPEAGLVTLLEAEYLEVDSEDCVVEAAMAWVRHRHTDGVSQARELCRLVLPRVHFPSLSPHMTSHLAHASVEHFRALWALLQASVATESSQDVGFRSELSASQGTGLEAGKGEKTGVEDRVGGRAGGPAKAGTGDLREAFDRREASSEPSGDAFRERRSERAGRLAPAEADGKAERGSGREEGSTVEGARAASETEAGTGPVVGGRTAPGLPAGAETVSGTGAWPGAGAGRGAGIGAEGVATAFVDQASDQAPAAFPADAARPSPDSLLTQRTPSSASPTSSGPSSSSQSSSSSPWPTVFSGQPAGPPLSLPASNQQPAPQPTTAITTPGGVPEAAAQATALAPAQATAQAANRRAPEATAQAAAQVTASATAGGAGAAAAGPAAAAGAAVAAGAAAGSAAPGAPASPQAFSLPGSAAGERGALPVAQQRRRSLFPGPTDAGNHSTVDAINNSTEDSASGRGSAGRERAPLHSLEETGEATAGSAGLESGGDEEGWGGWRGSGGVPGGHPSGVPERSGTPSLEAESPEELQSGAPVAEAQSGVPPGVPGSGGGKAFLGGVPPEDVQRGVEAAETALGALVGALVSAAEERFIAQGTVSAGSTLAATLASSASLAPSKLAAAPVASLAEDSARGGAGASAAGAPLGGGPTTVGVPRGLSPSPRAGCQPPHGVVYVDIPLKKCREWQPSNAFLATSSPCLVKGRWFTLNIQVCAQNPTLGMYLICDKATTFPLGQVTSFNLDYRFCVQTAQSRPAYQHLVKSTVNFTENQMGWGRANILGRSWASCLRENETYFPDGGLRIRADLWIKDDAPGSGSDDAPEK